jgi:NADH:ubiquinone oxidoreductase subunit 6 (subunit J)
MVLGFNVLFFYFLAFFLLVGGALAVTLKSIFQSLLSFAVFLLSLAGIFLLLQAEVIGLIQILVYVGGIVALIIFTLMLIPRVEEGGNRGWLYSLPALAFLILFLSIFKSAKLTPIFRSETVSFFTLSRVLLSDFMFPLELIGVIIVASFITAYAISRREKS